MPLLRALFLALVFLAAALAPAAAQGATPTATAATPTAEGLAAAAAAPAAESPLVSQYRLSPAQAAILEQEGLTDPTAILADLQSAGVTPTSQLPMNPEDPTLYDYVMFAFIKAGDADGARRLLNNTDAKANANVKDAANGETPIFSAVEQSEQNPQLLSLLLANGADTNVRRNDGATPLLLAIAGGFNQTVGTLLGSETPLAGKDPNLASADGLTPLLAAIVSDQSAIAQQLLNAGAGPNTPGAGGELPLVEAVQANPADPAIVEALLDNGANPYLADATGTTAVQAAEQAGNPEIIQLLNAYGVPAPAAEAGAAAAPAPETGAAAAGAAPVAESAIVAAAAPIAEVVAARTSP